MLKRKIKKEDFDAMDEAQKALYVVDPGNATQYLLDVEPDADNGALVRAKAAEKARAEKAEARVAELETEVEGLNTQISAGRPEVVALEKSYKEKEQKLKDTHKQELAAKDKLLSTILVDNKAMELASKISTTPELIVPMIKARLKANISGDEPVTEVLDAGGLASTMTIEDLGNELVANPKYSAIMIGSDARGAGGSQHRPQGGALRNGKKFDDLTEAERVAWAKDDPKSFETASNANRNSKQRL